MRTLTTLVVAAVALGANAAFADDAALAREAQDRAAIEALMWRYVRALDSMDPDAYAAVFTEDGAFKSGSTQHHGRAEVKQMIADLKKTRDERAAAGTPGAPMYHVIANHQITFTAPNEARYFAGLFLWEPGELDEEVRGGAWEVRPADAGALFSPHPEELWRTLSEKLLETRAGAQSSRG